MVDKKLLYNAVISDTELTTKNLNNLGFKAQDINTLIDKKVLVRVKRGHYKFIDDYDLHKYGKVLNATKNFEMAQKCYNICYEINPLNRANDYQLLLLAIEKEDYPSVFKYFKYLYGYGHAYYQTDSKLIIYLLSFITDIPEEYHEIVKGIRLDDLLVNEGDRRYHNKAKQALIRKYINQKQFKVAYHEVNCLIRDGENTIQNYMTKKLLRLAIMEQTKMEAEILELVKLKKFKEIVRIIKAKGIQRQLTYHEKVIKYLCKEFFALVNNGKAPEISGEKSTNVFDAVYNHDFVGALKLSTERIEANNLEPDAIHLILEYINTYIEVMNRKNQDIFEDDSNQVESEPIIEEKKEEQVEVEVVEEVIETKNEDNEVDKISLEINKILSDIKDTKYEKLIINLIKLSLAGELIPNEPFKLISDFNEGKLNFDFNYYQAKLNEAILNGDETKEQLYYGVVKAAIGLGLNKIEEITEEVTETVEEVVETEVTEDVETTPIEDEIVSEETKEIAEPTNDPEEVMIKLPPDFVRYTEDGYIVTEKDVQLVNSKIEEVHETGIALLGPFDKPRRKALRDVAYRIPNIIAFSIGESEDSKYVVIKEKLMDYSKEEYNDLLTKAKELNKEEKYQEALEIYLKLMANKYCPSIIYGALGALNYRLRQKQKAIEYYTVTNYMVKELGLNYDYSDLLLKLTKGVRSGKPNFFVSEGTFDYDYDYYGIDNLEELAELFKNNVSFEKVCEQFEFTDEEKMLVGIIFAREYYTICNYKKGDYFYKKVSQIKNKPKAIKELLEEVYQSRNFYWNRVNENTKLLALSIHKDV